MTPEKGARAGGQKIPSTSLYIHVPFCSGRCAYCDFYSVPVKNDDPVLDVYVEKLLEDGKFLFSDYAVEAVPTVYIGGGTPSVLGAKRIKRLLEGLCPFFVSKNGNPHEITLEANPESADEAFLAAAQEAGVNRLSLGVQSFHEASRLSAGRGSDESRTLLPERLKLAAAYFPGALSVDLMSGFPFQDEEVLIRDIERTLEYEPAHISLYALNIATGTPLFNAVSRGAVKPPEQEEADRLWICGRDHLEKNGYSQYEVSNFCLPGKKCLHNMRYWHMENWLALGPSASATLINDKKENEIPIRGTRYTIHPDLNSWIKRQTGNPPPQTKDDLDAVALEEESLLMGFRLLEGPDTELFKRRFGKGLEDVIPHTLARLKERGLLKQERGPEGKETIALTKEGLLFLNRFLIEAFTELSASRC